MTDFQFALFAFGAVLFIAGLTWLVYRGRDE